jgi:tripartite-type tricarboxylate transporter receptor subunit TctC
MSPACLAKVIIGLVVGAAVIPASAQDGWKDRTITLYSAGTPGGGYDFYARLLARHLGRHLPGNPAVVVKNMPGAGGVVLANHL